MTRVFTDGAEFGDVLFWSAGMMAASTSSPRSGGGVYCYALGQNIDTTYIVTDNEVYGLTRGQLSPTAPTGLKTKMAPQGGVKPPINPVAMALDAGWTFVARAISVGEVNGI